MKLSYVLCSLMVVGSLSSCGADMANNGENFDSESKGAWYTECIATEERESDINVGEKLKRTLEFDGMGGFGFSEIHYSDTECSDESVLSVYTGSGKYTSTIPMMSEGAKREIAFSFSSFAVTVKNEDLRTSLSEKSFCDINNWGEEEVSLIGMNCKDSDGSLLYESFTSIPDIIDIDLGRMWLGTKSSFLSKTKPSVFDENTVYLKR